MRNLVFCFCIVTLMVSCKPAQTIVYSTDKLKTLEAGNNVNLSFSVQTFEDIRSESEINEIHFAANQWQVRINRLLREIARKLSCPARDNTLLTVGAAQCNLRFRATITL